MSEPNPNSIKSHMNFEKFVMYSAGLGMLTQLTGWVIGSRVVTEIGKLGFLPLGLLYFAFFVVIIWVVISQVWKALTEAVSWCLGKPPSPGNETQDSE